MDDPKRQDVERKRTAIAELHESLFPRIVRYVAVRIGDFSEAEDLASEVFVRALRAAESYVETKTPMEAWIFRIAHNIVVDHLRRRTSRPRPVSIEESEVDVAGGTGDPQGALERVDEIRRLRAALEHLTDAQRQVLAMRFSDDELTSEQIGAMLGKKPTAVREMQSAAVKRLRAILAGDSI